MLKPKEQKDYTCPNCNQILAGLRGEKVKIHINMCLPEFFKKFNHLRTLPNPRLIIEVGKALKKGLISRPKSDVKRKGLLPSDQPTPPAPTRVVKKKSEKKSAIEGSKKATRDGSKPRGLPFKKEQKGNLGIGDIGKLPESNLINIIMPESEGWTPMIDINTMLCKLSGKKKRGRCQVQFANTDNFIPEKRKRYDPEITVDLFESAVENAKKKTRRTKDPEVEELLGSLFLDGLEKSRPEKPWKPLFSNEELAKMTQKVTMEVEELQKSNEAMVKQNGDFWEKCISQLEDMSKKPNADGIENLTKDILSKCPEPLKAPTTKESIEWNWLIMRGLRRDGAKLKSQISVG